MFSKTLRRALPRGLYGRAALILLLPVLTLQFIVGLVFIQRHFEGVTEQMTQSVVLELQVLRDAPPDRRAPLADALGITLGGPAPTPARVFYDLSGKVVVDTLTAAFPALGPVDLSNHRRVRTSIATQDGPLVVDFSRQRVSASNPHQLLVIMGVMGLLLTLVAFIFLRNQLRPMARLARAAEAYGRGQILPYRVAGSLQVRAAGLAFLQMRDRIERQSQARRLMLSGLSHDLRTPLTRMRLELSMMEDPGALPQDVEDMSRLVDAFLDYARGDTPETSQDVDLETLLTQTAARAGPIDLTTTPVTLHLRPLAIRRAVDNLIGNAQRHGSKVSITLTRTDDAAIIAVEDNGPGIPQDQHAEAVRPFTRLDPARNQDKGSGVGLGLAIVSDIARSHGGRLRLDDSPTLGGLRARLVLPLPPSGAPIRSPQ